MIMLQYFPDSAEKQLLSLVSNKKGIFSVYPILKIILLLNSVRFAFFSRSNEF